MELRVLGKGGVKVSRLGLGTSTWGATTALEDAEAQLRLFVGQGGTLVDTADIYGAGKAEEIVGRLVGTVIPRAEIVLATKAVGVLGRGARRADASRKHLLAALDSSLRKLRTDYLDLWQLHAWDGSVPLEETMSALDTAVTSGRVRQVGVCNYSGWQTAKAAAWQAGHGQAELASTQVEYSLLERGIEREVLHAAADQGMGVLPWAPLGRGVLTGKYLQGVPADRAGRRFFEWYVGPFLDERATKIVEAVHSVAAQLGVSTLAVSLSWVRDRPGVVAPLVGARTVEQLRESLAPEVDALVLPADVRAQLDEVSKPHVGYPENFGAA